MAHHPTTPPYTAKGSPETYDTAFINVPCPDSTNTPAPEEPTPTSYTSNFNIPTDLTQAMVNDNPQLKRLQQDLLVLTSFPDNSSLTWRPSWFLTPTSSSPLWTLHNPPHAVTEQLPSSGVRGRRVMTRGMRGKGDGEPMWMTTQARWERYCRMYGVPYDFLCEDQIRLLRLGLQHNANGQLRAPPLWPLYPEPPHPASGCYVISANMHMPMKFWSADHDLYNTSEYVVVHPDGTMYVQELPVGKCMVYRGHGRRWSHVPWTREQELSCRPPKLRLRFWNSAITSGI